MGSISHHITPLVINSLESRHTEHTHMYTDIHTEKILRNQVHTGTPGLTIKCHYQQCTPAMKLRVYSPVA